MPLRTIRSPRIPLEQPARETDKASLGDLIREVALSIADAQKGLDASSAEMVRELAETRVEVVSAIRESISSDGSISYTQDKPRSVSLLEIGVMPTFYQFAQTVVEIQMDLKVVETESEKGTKSQNKRMFLQADTAGIRFERKLNRDVSVCSKVKATLVPVPMPLRIEPVRTTTDADAGNGG
ncbi:hypothetical protein [Desulfonatronospira sp.]|uniref:hypothetical protein n=1 Tax=Desulfonatronospira sp. TaxID=1962951 RepID=UPI0025BDA878|nr:hypothetical protein [Desulfonatronospira sp.]